MGPPINGACRHQVVVGGGKRVSVDLNDFNHAVQLFESVAGYAAARTAYIKRTIDRLAKIEDAITGNSLNIDDQVRRPSLSLSLLVSPRH